MESERARLAISVLDLTDLGDDTDRRSPSAPLRYAAAGGGHGGGVRVAPLRGPARSPTVAGLPVRVATVVDFPSGDEPSMPSSRRRVLPSTLAPTRSTSYCPYRSWLAGDEASATAVLDGVRDGRGVGW